MKENYKENHEEQASGRTTAHKEEYPGAKEFVRGSPDIFRLEIFDELMLR